MFLFLPIKDRPRAASPAVATYVLIAINVAVFVLVTLPLMGTSAHDAFLFEYGFRPSSPSWVSLITHMFIHGSFMHLAGNMLFLWLAGHNVEYRLGRLRYVVAYIVMGVVASIGFALSSGGNAPMVGASGAIFGVLGCYFLWFPKNRVVVLVLFVWLFRVVALPARIVLGGYVLVADVLPILIGEADSVAHGAHIGGFIAGLVIAHSLNLWYGERRAPRSVSGHGSESLSNDDFSHSVNTRAWDQALRQYSSMTEEQRNALQGDHLFRLADGLTDDRRHGPALSILQRYIATRPNASDLAQAHLRAGQIQLHAMGRPAAAYQHALTVLDLHPSSNEERLARETLLEIAAAGERTLH